MFEPRAVHFERTCGICAYLNNTIRVHPLHFERPRSSGTELARKEFQPRIENENQVALLKLSPVDKPIMPPLHLLLIVL